MAKPRPLWWTLVLACKVLTQVQPAWFYLVLCYTANEQGHVCMTWPQHRKNTFRYSCCVLPLSALSCTSLKDLFCIFCQSQFCKATFANQSGSMIKLHCTRQLSPLCDAEHSFVAEPEEKLWSTPAIAAPEVIRTYQEGATTALYKQVRFGPQDCYSLGCILLWLWTGMLPFIVTGEERQIHGITTMAEYLAHYLKKQAQGVSLLSCCTCC